MTSKNLTLYEIRTIGFDALIRELGSVGAICFIQQYESGHGDYTECVNDLKQLFQKISVDSLSSRGSKVLLSRGEVGGGLIQTAVGKGAGAEGPFTKRSGFFR